MRLPSRGRVIRMAEAGAQFLVMDCQHLGSAIHSCVLFLRCAARSHLDTTARMITPVRSEHEPRSRSAILVQKTTDSEFCSSRQTPVRSHRQPGPADEVCDKAVRAIGSRLKGMRRLMRRAADKSVRNVEHVHDFRVWTRRASAAMRLFQDYLPRRRAGWINRRLKRMGRMAGRVRDCDVVARGPAGGHDPGTKRWLEETLARRAETRKPLVAAYQRTRRSRRFKRQVRRLLRRLKFRGRATEGGPPRFADWARARIRETMKRFFAASPGANAGMAGFHRFRIRARGLRYTMEILVDAFPPGFREKLYPRITAVQERLGRIHDLAVEQDQLGRRLKATHSVAEEVLLRHVLGGCHLRSKKMLKAFSEWCTPGYLAELRAAFEEILDAKARPGAAPRASPVRRRRSHRDGGEVRHDLAPRIRPLPPKRRLNA
jgi:CHAD domain-containing protein